MTTTIVNTAMKNNKLEDTKPLILSSFVKVFKESREDNIPDHEKEIEVRFKIASLKLLKAFITRQHVVSVNLEARSFASSSVSKRLRIPMKDLSFDNTTNFIINDAINNSHPADEKTTLYEDENQYFKTVYSRERLSPFDISKRKISVLTVIRAVYNFFIVEIKIKNNLDHSTKQEKLKNRMLCPLNRITYSLEVELRKGVTSSLCDVTAELDKILSMLFGKTSGAIILRNEQLFPKIRTYQISFLDLKRFKPSDIIITPKIDGEFVTFQTDKGYIYFYMSPIVHCYKTNTNESIQGYGEFLKSTREIYPFALYQTNSTRKDQFDFLSQIKYTKSTPDMISIRVKPYWNGFESYEDVFFKIQDICQESVANTDGMILIDNSALQKEEISYTDYKLKFDNTIDILASLAKYGKDENGICLKLYHKNGDDLVLRGETRSDKEFCFNLKQNLINYIQGTEINLLPFNFIVEYNLTTQQFFPRIDKTEKYLQTGYSGNHLAIIQKIEKIEKENIDLDYFLSLDQNNIRDLIDRMDDNKVEMARDYIIEPLNQNRNWHKINEPKKKKPDVNDLINSIKATDFYCSSTMATGNDARTTIFSIYNGRNNDMARFIFINASHVFSIEPSIDSSIEAQKRYDIKKKQEPNIFEFLNICERLETRNLAEIVKREAIKHKFPTTYDHVACHLGLHFSYNKETSDHILDFISSISHKGTIVAITTNNPSTILPALQQHEDRNLILSFETLNYSFTLVSDTKIEVMIEPSMESSNAEYLVYAQDLIGAFEKHGFALLQAESLDKLIYSSSTYSFMSKCLVKQVESNSGSTWLQKLSQVDLTENHKTLLSFYMNYLFTKL